MKGAYSPRVPDPLVSQVRACPRVQDLYIGQEWSTYPIASLLPISSQGPRLLEDKGSSVLNNRMVGLSVGQMHATGLSEPVEITFSHQHQSPVSLYPGAWQLLWGHTMHELGEAMHGTLCPLPFYVCPEEVIRSVPSYAQRRLSALHT